MGRAALNPRGRPARCQPPNRGAGGLPAPDVQRIHAAVVAAFNDPAVKDAMARQGNTIAITTPEQAAAGFRSELAKYARLVKKAGLEAK